MRSLSDTWHGRFSYPSAAPENEFVATLLQVGARLSGAIHEVHNDGAHAGLLLSASIDGRCDGSAVAFVKRYDQLASPVGFDQVQYDGTVDEERSEIAGTWRIGAQPPGRFVMIRANRRAFAAQDEMAATPGVLVPSVLVPAGRR